MARFNPITQVAETGGSLRWRLAWSTEQSQDFSNYIEILLFWKKQRIKKEHHLVSYTKYTVIIIVILFLWIFLVKVCNNANIKMVVLY